jgi:rRNA maturation endonuclease Nob1
MVWINYAEQSYCSICRTVYPKGYICPYCGKPLRQNSKGKKKNVRYVEVDLDG